MHWSQIMLLALFASALFPKLRDPSEVAATIQHGFGVAPARARRTAMGVIAVDALALVALAADRRVGAIIALGVLALYATGGFWVAAAGRTVPCRCFGWSANSPLGTHTVVRNVLLAVVAVVALASDAPFGPTATNALIALNLAVAFVVVDMTAGWRTS